MHVVYIFQSESCSHHKDIICIELPSYVYLSTHWPGLMLAALHYTNSPRVLLTVRKRYITVTEASQGR